MDSALAQSNLLSNVIRYVHAQTAGVVIQSLSTRHSNKLDQQLHWKP